MAVVEIPQTGLWGGIADDINANFAEVKGDVTGWNDNIQVFASAKGRGTSEPVWEDMGNGQFNFLFTVGDELFLTYHVQHDYKLGSDAYPHIHFLVTDALSAGQQITWRFAYVLARGHSQGESLTVAETVINMTYTATGAEIAGEHIVLECEDIDAFDLLEPDTLVCARVELISENVTGDIFGIMADLHYQTDRHSTLNKAPNFYE